MHQRSRTLSRLRHHRGGMSLPEPCYPPPCPGVDYEHHGDTVTQQSLISIPGNPNVDSGNAGMDVNADNTGAPTQSMGPSDPSFSEHPQGYVIMLPAPPIPLTNDDDDDSDEGGETGSSSDVKQEKADMKKADKLSQKIELKTIALNQHDNWIADAKAAIAKVNEHLQAAQTSRDSISVALDSLKGRHDELVNKYKVDRLKRKLDMAKETLTSLQSEVGGLHAANSGLEAAQKNVEAKVSLLAEKLNLQRDQAEAKAKEFDKANQRLTTVVDNFEEYSPDHISL